MLIHQTSPLKVLQRLPLPKKPENQQRYVTGSAGDLLKVD
jgi:hypothetical protein